jgi:hypothetical protein
MKAGISGRKVLRRNRNKLYTLIDGVFTPMLYEQQETDGNYYYSEVLVTDPERITRQQLVVNRDNSNSNFNEIEVLINQTAQGTTTTSANVSVTNSSFFTYKRGVLSNDSDGKYSGIRVSDWNSIKSDLSFTQSTTLNQPYVGGKSGGRVGFSTPYFDKGSSFMTSSANITLQNNFTIFALFNLEIKQKARLLGNNSDADVFVSFNENSDENLHIGFGSGNTYIIPTTTKLELNRSYVLTLVRKSNVLTTRIDGVKQAETNVTSNDLVINTLGRAIDSSEFFGGSIGGVQFWNGALSLSLDKIESALIKQNLVISY